MRIFIAGPYGDSNPRDVIAANVRRADKVARILVRLGHDVYCPHKMAWGWEADGILTEDDFQRLNETFLLHWATHIYRIPGKSAGADREVETARSRGLSIYTLDFSQPAADMPDTYVMSRGNTSTTKPQPMPQSSSGDITELVIADLKERRRIGIAKYGTTLQAFNSRDAFIDAYQEALDLVQYLRQIIAEKET